MGSILNMNKFGGQKFEFSAKYLNQLVDNDNSGVKVCRNCIRVFQLKNKYVDNPKEGLKAHLDSTIPQYDIELDGLIMAYKNVKILTPVYAQDRTLFDSMMAVNVSFDVYYLPFMIGSILEGTVSHVEEKHMVCHVHNIFHVSVLKPYSKPFEEWGGSKVKLGDTVEIEITAKLLREDIPYVQGKLLSESIEPDVDRVAEVITGEVTERNVTN
ncbi:unnamed protein product [Bemisia tabaci]|uniref:Uncharacterized protein n=1 Tax=Bemisia tabaci TaxID=7038 RepID=A0A9P0F0F8_BEMTA|nr:unnamed protein product [Bemisia tabaci]